MNYYAGYLYDAVMLYGLTVDAMIKDGFDPTNGRAFLTHSQSIFFQGKDKIQVTVSEIDFKIGNPNMMHAWLCNC